MFFQLFYLSLIFLSYVPRFLVSLGAYLGYGRFFYLSLECYPCYLPPKNLSRRSWPSCLEFAWMLISFPFAFVYVIVLRVGTHDSVCNQRVLPKFVLCMRGSHQLGEEALEPVRLGNLRRPRFTWRGGLQKGGRSGSGGEWARRREGGTWYARVSFLLLRCWARVFHWFSGNVLFAQQKCICTLLFSDLFISSSCVNGFY